MPMAPAFDMFRSLGHHLPRLMIVGGIVALPFLHVGSTVSAQSTPVVDAGPAKSLAFPAKDLTLFGHATDPNPLRITWTRTTGPAAVTFSAPWALATTVTFTIPGTYTFQLAASNGTSTGTSSVTVTVNPASSQTAFYVDPTYTGSTQDGSASAPWKSLLDSDSDHTAKWNAVNSALATNDVIIYFSARQAGSDTSEQLVPPPGGFRLFINRTCRGGTFKCPGPGDTSTHRLTVDGMSLYNTNDATPNWVTYTGTNKFKLNCISACGSIGLGWDDSAPRDYVTIRGFELTGNSARMRWGGSYSVLEYMFVHDLTTIGATVQFDEATNGPACNNFGIDHDITIRGNTITKGFGEGIYVAGNYNLASDGGCVTGPNSGDNHYDILIENNTESYTGFNGGQGDGIDIKSGIYNVTVRGNTISFTHDNSSPCEGAEGITILGRMNNSTHESNYLIENNVIHDLGCASVGNPSNGIDVSGLQGVTIRNNLIYTIPGRGIIGWTRQTGTTPNELRIKIYDNTIYAAATGVSLSDFSDAPVLRNNLIFSNTNNSISGNPPSIDSDYNLMAPTGSRLSEGSHSLVQSSTSGIVVNPAGANFHLIAGSPAIVLGVSLASTFAIDIAGTSRPQATAWDIGAYQFSKPPLAPTNFRIVP